MIVYLGAEVIIIICYGKSVGGLDIHGNFSKIVIECISNVSWVIDCFITNCNRSEKNMVRIKIWPWLFNTSFSATRPNRDFLY